MKTYITSHLKTFVMLLSSFVTASCGNKDEGIKPEMKPLREAVYASGFVVAKDEYEITSQAEGYVSGKLVRDGDVVKKGDPLYVIDADQQSARTRIAQESFELAAKNYADDSPVLRELKAAVESSQGRMQFDSLNFARYTNLLQKNAASQVDFDRMQLAYENSRNEYILQKSRFTRTKNQLHLEYQNAKNNLLITSDESGRYMIRSAVDGMVFMTAKDKGELIRRNEVVAVVGKKDAFYVQLNVDELDVHRINEGQDAVIKIDAYPEKIFNATVTKVYPIVDRKQQVVRVDADLKEPLPGWFSGLALEGNIIIRKRDNAVVIPKSFLLPGDSVLVETDEGSRKIKVEKGIETLDEVEIVQGLDTSNLLVLK